jgi:hypothetical protein
MSDFERALREKARQRIQSGMMPLAKPSRTWGGPGAGLTCPVCALPILRDEVEYQVEFVLDEPPRLEIHHLHLACFAAWELEREALDRATG